MTLTRAPRNLRMLEPTTARTGPVVQRDAASDAPPPTWGGDGADRAPLRPTSTLRAASGQAAGVIQRRAVVQMDEAKDSPAAAPADPAAAPAPAPADPAAYEQKAKELLPQLREQEAAQRKSMSDLDQRSQALDEKVKAAAGDEKAKLEAEKKDVDQKLGKASGDWKQTAADVKALEEPGASTATYNAILARQKAGAGMPTVVEDGKAPTLDEKKGLVGKAKDWTRNEDVKVENRQQDGAAVTKTTEKVEKVGLGYEKSDKTTTVTTGVDGKSTASTGSKTTAGKDGVSYEKTDSQSQDKDGKSSGSADKSSYNVGPNGASMSKEHSEEKADGTKGASKGTVGVERGDGKLGGKADASVTKTDADGNEKKIDGKVKAGVIAGKDGIGGYGSAEAGVEKKGKDGVTTGVVGGLDGNVVCNVVAVEGGKYAVTVTVNLGGKVGVTAGEDKEGAAAKGSLGASASGSVTMSVRKTLTDEEAKAYVEAVKKASAGGGGTDRELAIISTGVTKGWDAARAMYQGAQASAGDPKALEGMKDGDKIELSKEGKVGASGSVNAGVLGVQAGVDGGKSSSMSVEKKDGKLVYEKGEGDSKSGSVGVNADVGVVKGGISVSGGSRSSTKYTVTIDPKDPNAAAMQKELAACDTQDKLDAFAKKYPQTVGEKTKTEGHDSGQSGTIGVGPASASIKSGASYDESTTTDADGKVKSKEMAGSNGGGIEVGVGSVKVGASTKESAKATVDGAGNASLDVNQTDTSTNGKKLLAATVPGAGDKQDDKGALAKVTGAKSDADTTDTHQEGIKLGNDELDRLAAAAQDPARWMSFCPVPRLRDDWAEARKEVIANGGDRAAAAKALSKFVGKGGPGRDDIVYGSVRGKDGTGGGARYEFPQGLAGLKPEYDALVAGNPLAGVDDTEQKEGKAKALEVAQGIVKRLDSLYAALQTGQDKFENAAAFGEMIGSVTKRKDEVAGKVRELSGGKADALSDKDWMDKYNGLLGDCQNMKGQETTVFGKIEESYKDGKPGLDASIENGKLIKQLRDLYEVWRPKYDEMAGIAQQRGYGKDIYWKYKPDEARFARAQAGNPGAATPAEPEKDDKRPQKKEDVPASPKDPVGDSNKQLDKQRAAQATGISGKLAPAKNKAYGAGNRLMKALEGDRKTAAVEAHNRGMEKLKSGESWAKKLPKDATTEDWEAYGAVAVQDFEAAAAAFGEGLALY